MAHLSTLPNEVLRMIIRQVMPEDLENFAQTSKHIQSVSASAVENHRRLIRRYASFSDQVVPNAVKPLLKDVLANPRIGHYVKKVELCRVPEEDGSVNNMVDNRKEDLSLDRIHAAVNECELLNPWDTEWLHYDVDESGEVLVALLLSSLPYLTVLSITEPTYFSQFYLMIERAKKQDTQFLSRLQHVLLQCYDLEHNGYIMSLAYLEAFLRLPSLQKLSGAGVRQTLWSRNDLEPPQTSNLTELELRECYIDSKIVDRFLQQLPHLQSFVYTNHTGDYDSLDVFDPFIIRAALQSRVSFTLRNLTILMDARTDEPKFMGPLCGFKALEHVHGDWMSLLPDGLGFSPFLDDEVTLSLILPKSLKVLSVRDHGPSYKENHRKLIDRAIRAKRGPDASLPHLEALEFWMKPVEAVEAYGKLQDGADEDLQKRCDEVGLSLLFKDK